MRFVMINPPSTYPYGTYIPVGLASACSYISKRHKVVPIDLEIRIRKRNYIYNRPLTKMSGFLKQRAILDVIHGQKNSALESEIRKLLRMVPFGENDILCFSNHTYRHTLISLLLAKEIRRHYDNPIIFGGAYFFSSDYQFCYDNFTFLDILAVGTIDSVYSDMMKALSQKRRGLIINLKKAPEFIIPSYSEEDIIEYQVLGKKKLYLPIETSRGCANRCSFCVLGKFERLQIFPAKKVVRGIKELLIKHKLRNFYFVNQSINNTREEVTGLCQNIIDSNLAITWQSYCRLDTLDEYTIALMSKSGCSKLLFGLESGSRKVLALMNKRVNLQNLDLTFRICYEYGIKVDVFIMVGFPGETLLDLEDTLKVIKKNAEFINYVRVSPFGLRYNSQVYIEPGKYDIKITSQHDTLCRLRADFFFSCRKEGNIDRRLRKMRLISYRHILRNKYYALKLIPFRLFESIVAFRETRGMQLLERLVLKLNPSIKSKMHAIDDWGSNSERKIS